MTTLGQDNQYISISTPLGKDKLILRELAGEDSVSGLFHYRIKMLSDDETLAFDRVIGKTATVTIKMGETEVVRYIDGIVTRFELTSFDDRENIAYYEAELRPWLWLLTLSGDCRIFQDKTVPEIVEKVCTDAGYAFVKKSLTGTYAAREYCVQFGETDYNFVARLLEEEGIFFYFSHSDGKHEMVLGDAASAFVDCPSVKEIRFRPNQAFDTDDDVVTSLRLEQAVTTKTVGVDSFNFETPSTDLYTKAEGKTGIGSRHLYTHNYLQSTQGEGYAKVLQQANAVQGKTLHGSGRLRSLVAGGKVTVKNHPRAEINAEYVLSRVRVEASRTDYLATFNAFPSATQYRPMGTSVKPRIHSSQTAIVVGAEGDEILTDKYGRIKVKFHWDRAADTAEKSSCWIRVAQNWAGKAYGIWFLPRVGQEVVVSFLDGDPDKPLVTGAVYNAEQTLPYALPANATKSTIKTLSTKEGAGKFNEIRFEDKKDAEEIYIHAQKDMVVDVLNDYKEDVKHDHLMTVKNDRKTAVTEGNYDLKVEKGTRSIKVKGAETHINEDSFEHKVAKDYTLKIDGNLTITVTGDVVFKGKSLSFESTSAEIKAKSSTDMKLASGAGTEIKSGAAMAIKSGAALDVKSAMDTTLDAGMNLNAKGGMNVAIKGGLGLTAEGGASTTVKSGGITAVKGSLVQIN
ncbi:type VI secretion system Vgr family protein [Arenibaculum pallidiluteum]|uniref:type VI secretion system Vgr family protein n=1 Tax=Arenibaculum pallidiluteum TaxID=2812559 RepID=UPI001A96B031|nr:type VI secretion system tip protein TssI/VgrG [Arenibaculum pallidiluteum]